MATELHTKNGRRLRLPKPAISFHLRNSPHCASKSRNSKCFLIALPSIAAASVPTNAHLSQTWPSACKRTILRLQQPRATGSRDWRRNIRCEWVLKHLKIDTYEISDLVLIVLAILLRVLLAAHGWPR